MTGDKPKKKNPPRQEAFVWRIASFPVEKDDVRRGWTLQRRSVFG